MATPAQIKTLFNLPAEVPDALLQSHLDIAENDLYRDTEVTRGNEPVWGGVAVNLRVEWAEALKMRAYANVVPYLHTFYLQGASRAERLAHELDARFMSPQDWAPLKESALERYRELVGIVRAALYSADTAPGEVRIGGLQFMVLGGATTAVAATVLPSAVTGADTVILIAAVDLSGHRALVRTLAGTVEYADYLTPAHDGLLVGLGLHAASALDSVTIATQGTVNEPSWAWSPGPIYLGASGLLTQNVAGAGMIWRLGTAIGAQTILWEPEPPIHLN